MDAFMSRLTLRQFNEHRAFWRLNGPMGIKRLDLLFADMLSWYFTSKSGKQEPVKKFLLDFGKDPEVALEERRRTDAARMAVHKKQHSPEAQRARRDARKQARDKRRGRKPSQ